MVRQFAVVLLLVLVGCQPAGDKDVSMLDRELIMYAEQGDSAAVLELLKKGANINARDARGRTAIMAATHGNNPDTVKLLIDAGADINAQDDRKDNPLLYAGAEGLLDIVKLMIDAGADPAITNRYGGTALIPAADRGHVEIVEELLERSAVNIDHVNNLGWTALLEAILLGDGGPRHQRIVELLVKHGADVNVADGDGVSPLEHARKRGYEEMEVLLSNSGAHEYNLGKGGKHWMRAIQIEEAPDRVEKC
ncbi:ankyrin repeat domain-containing protein [Paenibacillus oenotherae]|uniref:Ankyrin repeat domain-containing protein n=1 Tax=Paenibacillus oenotherae TaxID=1435645 RepID=A0ABS7D8L0_9BACL|nr:ankyrin repeat domain-containing protein [Paenibacillus oenotherae]MBW7476098.1 ankyrin repeat domain-containing protein [Paenibacillus oenotherae]